MNFDLSEEQKMLRDSARRLLRETAGFDRVRAHLQTGEVFSHFLWDQAASLGWLGVALPETRGGLGLGPIELCVLSEELGRSLAPIPFFSTVCLGAEILKRSAAEEAQDLLRRISAGQCIVTLAAGEADEAWRPTAKSMRWNGRTLSGARHAVADLMAADHVIVAALDGRDAPVLLLLRSDSPGLSRKKLEGLDSLRPHGELAVREAQAVVLARDQTAINILETIWNQAAVITAFEQIGGAEGAMMMARDHALTRFAFGRPIGGNQAVKHRLADMLVKIELARSNAYFGAWAMEQDEEKLPGAAAAARISATEAFEFAAEENLHLHGGIGYTWEANCHFYYRRARLLAVCPGNQDFWSGRLLHSLSGREELDELR